MKKEIDTWKLERLFDVFKTAMLWAWYLSGIGVAACLWFFAVKASDWPESRPASPPFAVRVHGLPDSTGKT